LSYLGIISPPKQGADLLVYKGRISREKKLW
jgi:hypothetical protein